MELRVCKRKLALTETVPKSPAVFLKIKEAVTSNDNLFYFLAEGFYSNVITLGFALKNLRRRADVDSFLAVTLLLDPGMDIVVRPV
jgi:hypothetical protein